jgi:hypothetical protein
LITCKHWLALLYTCRQVYAEAAPVVYRSTWFNVAEPVSYLGLEKMRQLLDMIGPSNARHVTKMNMLLPNLDIYPGYGNPGDPPPGFVTLEFDDEESEECLALLRENFPGLTTLSFVTDWREGEFLVHNELVPESLDGALAPIVDELKKCPSLSTVHVGWLGPCVNRPVAEKMLSLGWSVENGDGTPITKETAHLIPIRGPGEDEEEEEWQWGRERFESQEDDDDKEDVHEGEEEEEEEEEGEEGEEAEEEEDE